MCEGERQDGEKWRLIDREENKEREKEREREREGIIYY